MSHVQKRSYDENSLMDKAIGINCLGGEEPTRRPEFPTVNCPVRRASSLALCPGLGTALS